jgi:4-amino-4-deoxy-L-arabinose transferase and related glycosyltransferases of PMT family
LVEREWREASDLRTSRLALAIVLISAAFLRLWAIHRGIPYAVQVDEPEIVERALNMMRSGSLHPHFFDYPGLSLYLQLVVSIVRFVSGAIAGEWYSLAQATGGSFYLWGRIVTALFGVATVLLVYQIGMRWGARHALLASGLMAVLPLHVRYSHYVLTDTPLTFFVTLTFLLSLVAHERGTLASFVIAGAAAGLAAATKYNGGVALLMPLLACWMTVPLRPGRLKTALTTIAASAGAFLLFAPYTILDLPAFLDNFARLANQYRVAVVGESLWVLYFKYLVRHTFGWPAFLLALGGMGLGIVRLVRGPGRVRWALAVVFSLVYYTMLTTQKIVFARYLLPLTPTLCVLAATGVVSGVSLLRRYEIPRAARTALIAALTIAALLPPALISIRGDRDMARESTVDQAYSWILQNIPAGASIVLERRVMLLPAQYRTTYVGQLRRKTYEQMRSEGAEYLIANSEAYGPALLAPHQYPDDYNDYMLLFTQSREIHTVKPTAGVPGPELRILQIVR